MQAIEICWPITVTRKALTPTSPIMLAWYGYSWFVPLEIARSN